VRRGSLVVGGAVVWGRRVRGWRAGRRALRSGDGRSAGGSVVVGPAVACGDGDGGL